MAPFSIPAPCIIPIQVPVFGGSRTIDTHTKIELLCETYLEHEVFYTLDGTKPQPYAGIVQGSKLHKYKSPFTLPAGKITIKAIALSARIHSMHSSIVTKCFEVVKKPTTSSAKRRLIKALDTEDELCQKLDFTGSLMIDTATSNDSAQVHTFSSSEGAELGNSNEDILPNGGSEQENDEKALESLSEVCSILEKVELGETDDFEKVEEFLRSHSSSFDENDGAINGNELSASFREKSAQTEECFSKIERPLTTSNMNLESTLYCAKCEWSVQYCPSCNTPSAITSKYCIQCGKKLIHTCLHCNELNCIIASFCQYCGRKLESEDGENRLNVSFSDFSTMTDPQTKLKHQQAQTSPFRKCRSVSKPPLSPCTKKLPSHSPGRGYWHQQLDYICNHLKSFAYNSIEFREAISEPALGRFQNAQVIKNEDSASVTVMFSPYILENVSERKSHH